MPTARNKADTRDAVEPDRRRSTRLATLPARGMEVVRRQPLLSLVLACGTAIILASGSSTAYYLIKHRPLSDHRVTIDAALALLDEGNLDEARKMAVRLQEKIGDDYHLLGRPLFIQGAVLAEEAARRVNPDQRQTIYLVASRYLEESRTRGFPPGREDEGRYLLATTLFNAGQYAESLPVLKEAYERMPGEKYVLARLLCLAYLRNRQPNLEQASLFNHVWLNDPGLSDQQREEALLRRADIALKQHDHAACRKALSRIAEDSQLHGQALVLEGNLLLEQGDQLAESAGGDEPGMSEAGDYYRQAIGKLQRAQSKDAQGTSTRQSQYLLGIAHDKLGDKRGAKHAFERAWRTHYGTPEALAATLANAEINQQEDRHDTALDMYLKTLEEAGPPEQYRNRWVPLDDLRGRLSVALQRFVADRGDRRAGDEPVILAFEELDERLSDLFGCKHLLSLHMLKGPAGPCTKFAIANSQGRLFSLRGPGCFGQIISGTSRRGYQ